jgi:autotransporter passenger strand-loop-strand repeat protein
MTGTGWGKAGPPPLTRARLQSAVAFSSDSVVDTTVNSGGVQYVLNGPIVDTTLNGGIQDVSGGLASVTIVNSGGTQFISHGYASGAVLNADGLQIISDGTAYDTSVNSSGYELVSFFGVTNSSTVTTSGTEVVSSGGAAYWTTVAGGLQYISGGGFASNTTISGGVEVISAGGVASATTIIGGVEYVGSGGTAIGTTISGDGTLELAAGAIDSNWSVLFSAPGAGLMIVDGTSMPTAVISGFSSGDVIYLTSVPFDSHGTTTLLSGNVLQVAENGSTYTLQLDPNANYSGTEFYLVQEAGSGTGIQTSPIPDLPPSSITLNAAQSTPFSDEISNTDEQPGSDIILVADNGADTFNPVAPGTWPDYQRLLNFSVNTGLSPPVQAAITAAHGSLQPIADGYGEWKYDLYATTFRLPLDTTPQEFLNDFMNNINGTVYNPTFNATVQFTLRESRPVGVGSIYDLKFPGATGALVVSAATPTYFDLTTISTPETGTHPENGTREFGYIQNADGTITFYTAAADRSNNFFTTIGNPIQNLSWTSMLQGLDNTIDQDEGQVIPGSTVIVNYALSGAPDPSAPTTYDFLIEYVVPGSIRIQGMRGQTNSSGQVSIVLPPNAVFEALLYNPATGMYGEGDGTASSSGSVTLPNIHVNATDPAMTALILGNNGSIPDVVGVTSLMTAGEASFSDIHTQYTHTVSVTTSPSDLGTLAAVVSQDTTGGSAGGVISRTASQNVTHAPFASLAAQ